MFATLPSRTQSTVAASILLLPIITLIAVGPELWGFVDELTAEALYTTGLSSLLVLVGVCGVLALPRTDAEINAAAKGFRALKRLL